MIVVREMPREAGKYVRKRKPFRAIQFHTAFEVDTPNETMKGASGDYLVEETPRRFVVMSAEKFNEQYEPWNG